MTAAGPGPYSPRTRWESRGTLAYLTNRIQERPPATISLYLVLGVLALCFVLWPANSATASATGERKVAYSTSDSSFVTTFEGIPMPEASDGFDPLVFHKRHFSDGMYRVIFKNDPFGVDETQLWKTADFLSWTKVSNSIGGDGDQFEDHIVLSDGTFVLYQSPTRNGGTSVWTGKDLTNLTKEGTPIPEPDGGVFYDEENGTIHIYTEDQDHTTGPGSDKLSHWTTPDDDLLNATQQSDAIDVTSREWHTGDPDIIKMSGTYYMFTDRAVDHPNYRISVFRSDNLHDWTLFQDNINPQRSGGDMVLTRHNDSFVAFTEYDNYAEDQDFGVGQWRVAFVEDETEQQIQIAMEGGGTDGLDRSFDATVGASNQAVGLVRLNPDSAGATLSSLTVQGDAPTSSGVESVGLFSSVDSALDPSEDTLLATQSVSGRFPSEVSFTGLDHSLGTGRHVFLTATLSESATGSVTASIESEGDITFGSGTIGSVNGTDQSTFSWLPLSSSPSSLPVELASFEARRTGKSMDAGSSPGSERTRRVELRWQTGSETTNAGFAIQRRQARSTGTGNDDAGWATIAFVESKAAGGTTSEPQSYRYVDSNLPFEADSLNYRLRQEDIAGGTSFSKVVTIAQTISGPRLLSTYPNPARTKVTVRFAVPERRDVTLTIYDVLGRRVRTAYAGETQGRRTQVLGLSGLSSGVYFLRLEAGAAVKTQRFTVVQ